MISVKKMVACDIMSRANPELGIIKEQKDILHKLII